MYTIPDCRFFITVTPDFLRMPHLPSERNIVNTLLSTYLSYARYTFKDNMYFLSDGMVIVSFLLSSSPGCSKKGTEIKLHFR